jgi:hypothetical protein
MKTLFNVREPAHWLRAALGQAPGCEYARRRPAAPGETILEFPGVKPKANMMPLFNKSASYKFAR